MSFVVYFISNKWQNMYIYIYIYMPLVEACTYAELSPI